MSADDTAGETKPMKTRRVSVGGKPFSSRNPTTDRRHRPGADPRRCCGRRSTPRRCRIIGGGTTYSAYFTEDAGLRANDDVRIAGVKVGTVDSTYARRRARCKVDFKVKNAFVGNQSTLQIKLKTLLGAKYLAIDSIGTKPQDPSTTIPTERTTRRSTSTRPSPS